MAQKIHRQTPEQVVHYEEPPIHLDIRMVQNTLEKNKEAGRTLHIEFGNATEIDPDAAELLQQFSGDVIFDAPFVSTALIRCVSEGNATGILFTKMAHFPPDALAVIGTPRRVGADEPTLLGLDALPVLDEETARYIGRNNSSEIQLLALAEVQASALNILLEQSNKLLALHLPVGVLRKPNIVEQIASFKEATIQMVGDVDLDPQTTKFFLDHVKAKEIDFSGVIETMTVELAKVLVDSKKEITIRGVRAIKPGARDILYGPLSRVTIEDEPESDEDASIKETVYALPEEARKEIEPWVSFFERHRNFKDIVIRHGRELDTFLQSHGVAHPELFHNLNAGKDVRPVAGAFTQFIGALSGDFGFDAFKETFKRRVGKDFSDDAAFLRVYSDDAVQAIADHLQHISHDRARLEGGHRDRAVLEQKIADPNVPDKARRQIKKKLDAMAADTATTNDDMTLAKAQALLATLSNEFSYRKAGEIGYALGTRMTDQLTLGDECSDCTSATISGMNFFTVPVWQTDPGINFLLQYDEKGKLAHKFVVLWEISSAGELLLTVDSAEVGNAQKDKPGMYGEVASEEKEKALVAHAVQFLRDWADKIGIGQHRLYAATISNTGTDEWKGKHPEKEVKVAKLGGLSVVKKILREEGVKEEPRVYLQSCKASGAPGLGAMNRAESEPDVFGKVEQCMRSFLESSDSASVDRDKLAKIFSLAKDDHKKAAQRMRVFLVMDEKGGGSSPQSKTALSIDKERLDLFLQKRGKSFERYFEMVMGANTGLVDALTVSIEKYQFTEATLYHLAKESELKPEDGEGAS